MAGCVEMLRRSIQIVALVAAAAALKAQGVGLTAPISGVVFDPRTHCIRVLTGYPGASILGRALADGIDTAEMAPDGTAALAVKDGRVWVLSGLNDGMLRWTALEVESGGIGAMTWSRDSSAAAIHLAAAHTVVLVNRPASAPALAAVDVSEAGAVRSMAVAGGGRLAAVGGENGLFVLRAGGQPMRVAGVEGPVTAVGLARGDRDVFAAEGARIVEVRDFESSAEAAAFAGLKEGSRAVGLALSPDGKLLLAADAACRCVAVYEVAARGAREPVALEIEPAFLKPLAGGRHFLLNAPLGDAPFWLLTAGDAPAAFFVSGGAE